MVYDTYCKWHFRWQFCLILFPGSRFNLEIRVGIDGEVLGNNQICFEEVDLTDIGVGNIMCLQALFGDWISINRTIFDSALENLIFGEIRVFGSKYNWVHTHLHHHRSQRPILISVWSRWFCIRLWYTYIGIKKYIQYKQVIIWK